MIVLASGSPRRHQLLTMLGIDHEVQPAHIPEERGVGESPAAYALRLAVEKATEVARQRAGDWVLGGDTVVVVDGDVLEKPESVLEAEAMLQRLSGRRHEVITAVALVRADERYHAVDETSVWFRELSPERIREYVRTGESLDKAGAYAAQGVGAILIDRIEGDFFGVMGFPVRLVVDLLERAGVGYHLTR